MTTMPLSELPSNHSARNTLGQPHGDLHDERSHASTPNGDENLDLLKNPSSIQSMLRNTTETGNVGQFSIKPSRVPPSPSLPRPFKTRVTHTKQRQPGAYHNSNEDSDIHHTQSHSRQELVTSNGSGSQSAIPKPHRGPARSPPIEDFRSYSTTKSSYTSHDPNTHHPHTNGIHGGPGGQHNMRPRSPFAYPTRLKRPGYRPSSPALSELNKQDRSQASLHRRPSLRTNSPSSLHTNGAPSPWRKGANRSDPLLRYYPQSAFPVSGRATSPSPTSTRPPTPKRSPSLQSIASSPSGLRNTENSSWINPQSQMHSPIFYDYTEAFGEQGVEQQDYSHYVTTSMETLAEHDTAITTYHELDASPDDTSRTDLTSENSPPKLKPQATDNRFDQTTSQFEVNDRSSMQALHKDLSEVPELPEGEISHAELDVVPAKHDDSSLDQTPQFPFPEKASPLTTSTQRLEQPPDYEPRLESPLRDKSMPSTLPVSESPNRHRSQPVDSLHLAHPSLQPPSEQRDSPKDRKAKSNTFTTPPPLGLSAVKESDHSKSPADEHRHSMQSLRVGSFEDNSGHEYTVTEIISPTPERSMTSPTTVSRFSKILSISDDMLDLDELANRIKGKDRTDSPMQGIMDSRTRVAHIEPSWRKRSVQLRDIATRQNAADYALVEESDSDDEPELTQGLRQTFCKSDQRPVSHLPRSPPITLPSQLVHRGFPGPLSIRRSPAVRRSTSDLCKVRDPPHAHTDREFESPEPSPNSKALTLENQHSGRIQLNLVQNSDSPSKLSAQECSTQGIEPQPYPLPPPNKELPSLPNEPPAIVSLSPPVVPRVPSLPFSFTPLIQRLSEDETASVAELEAVASSYLDQAENQDKGKESATPTPATELSPARSSLASLPDSRPWNLDTSYPWSSQQPKLEVTMPEPTEDSNRSTASLPRFRLRVQRASSTTEATGKITRCPSLSDTALSPFASSYDVFQGTAFRRKRYPTLSVMPGQINSSHDVIRSSPNQTRFVESFETQSPRIMLVPPSPGFEARSFFSDDSSQGSPRGIFRKRISALKNRRSRGASADEPRGYDRGLLNSALGRSRASGRSSRQSENTAITAGASSRLSQSKRARRRLVNKLRSWWQRGEDRVREWRWRRRYNSALGRSASADLYAGV